MSSNNNDNSGTIGVLVVLGMIAWFMMIAAYALACFLSIILTILSFIAWHRPLKLGKFIVQPHEARQFVGCGITGAIGLPAFAIFCSLMFELKIPDEWWFYIVTGGYAFGSIGLSMMLHSDDEMIVEPIDEGTYIPAAPPARQLPAPPTAPFHYASWDDEEERGS